MKIRILKILSFFLVISLFFIFSTGKVNAAAVSWDGGASTSNWSDANNWSNNAVPTADDDVTIATATTVNIAASTTVNSLTLGVVGGGTASILNFSYDAISSGALIIDSGDLTVYSGASITHSVGTTSIVGRIFINIQSGSATITGSIDASAKGYQQGYGPGLPSACVTAGCPGSGYGGNGGNGRGITSYLGGTTYGSLTEPTDLGTGGIKTGTGSGGKGGGAIKLIVSTTLTVSGSINTNGGAFANGGFDPGGSSGGSVYITATTISGNGSITSNGGNGDATAGGGGGGRISLNYTTLNFSGTLSAYGGTPANQYGGAGTIYKKPSSQTYGDLVLDNNNQNNINDRYIGNTPLGSYTLNAITVQNYGRLETNSSTNVTYSSLTWSTKGIIVDNGGTFALVSSQSSLTIPSTSYFYANYSRTFDSLTINGILTHSKNVSTETYKINLTVTNDTTINSGGSINVNELGYGPTYGTGAGETGTGAGGGGYGGDGGDGTNATVRSGGSAYGSLYSPVNIGSGGGNGNDEGGNGGGAVKITTGGTTTISGSISANGGNYQGLSYDPGGGSGGSIYLISNNLAGTSSITANGGNGDTSGGGGGGGRIAIYYSNDNSYSGSVTVNGGSGGNSGQQGTYVLKASGGELISTPFDSNDPATLIYDLRWSETLTSGSDVKIQLRTAPDSSGAPGTWSDWMGPNGIGTYFTDPTGGENIYSTQSDASNDQWFQYKVILSADTTSANVPTLSDITIDYVINTAPSVSITNSPTESSAGVVTVTYTLSDPEESTLSTYLVSDIGITLSDTINSSSTSNFSISSGLNLPSTGTILIDDEMISYTGKSSNTLTGISRGVNNTTAASHTSGASVWFLATGVTGNIGSSQSTSGTKTVNWTVSSDFSNLETSTAKIKIVANDGNLANQVGSDQVISILLDTKAPTSSDIFLNKRLGTITLQSSDTNAIYFKASNNNDLSNDNSNNYHDWTAYTSSINWSFSGDPSTVYVKYKDAYGNETATISTESPTKLSSLIIQDASNPATSEWRLFVSWVTATVPSNAFDYYQIYRSTDGNSYSALTQVNDIAQNYYIDSGLDNATTYYYKVAVIDGHGNESDTNYPIQTSGSSSRSGIGLTPDGSGGGDFTAPSITSVAVSNITTTTATVTWTTNELSDSKVGYSTDTSYDDERGSITMTTSHSLVLSNLDPETEYYFRVISYDAVNNKSTKEDSAVQNFTTLADSSGPTLSNIKSVVGETTAGITWSTNELSDSLVEYSLDSSYSESSSSADLVQGHAITLSGLDQETTYNYRVTSVDSYGNSTTSTTYTLTTTGPETAADTTAPSISSISVSSITDVSAVASWTTNENADGKVEYGETTSYERGIAEGNHNFTTSKSVTMIGLSPSTTYHYRVLAVDVYGNINTSSDGTFSTSSQSTVTALSDTSSNSSSNAPSISSAGPLVSEITGTSAKVTWTTSKKSTSQVYFKVKGDIGSPMNNGDLLYVTSHSVVLNNLSPATTYEYQVKSVDVNGNYSISNKYQFTTTLPNASSISIVRKSPREVLVSWITASPTITNLEYTNSNTSETKEYVDKSLVTNHSALLKDLDAATVYSFEILVSDPSGETARSETKTFVTDKDNNGPQISGINSKSTITSGKNSVQTLITWITDEPSTSQVEYSLGSGNGEYDQKTVKNMDYVVNHIAVISDLKPSSVYRFRVISDDRSKNTASSEPYVLLTPQKAVSALDLIVQNLQSSFGWVKKLTP